MSSRLQDLEPGLAPWAAWLIAPYAQYVQVTSTRRGFLEQLQLYLAYVRGESRYPAAPPGTSMHERGRAFDIAGPTPLLRYLGARWRSVGGRWYESDPIHFEA